MADSPAIEILTISETLSVDSSKDAGQHETAAISEAKDLYGVGDADCDCCMRWSEYREVGDENEKLNKLAGRYAIVRRHKHKMNHSGENQWVLDSLKVQNQQLKDVLQKVFVDYPGINADAQNLTFQEPFRPLFHRWNRLVQFADNDDDPVVRKLVRLLLDAVRDSLTPGFAINENLKATGMIDFKSLWAVFVPGEILVTHQRGIQEAGKLRSIELVESSDDQHWSLEIEQSNWNGRIVGVTTRSLDIAVFDEARPLREFQHIPLHMHQEQARVTESLITRGRKFEGLRGLHYSYYNGIKADGMGVEKQFKGRIIVDALAWQKYNAPILLNTVAVTRNDHHTSSEDDFDDHHHHSRHVHSGPFNFDDEGLDILDKLPHPRDRRSTTPPGFPPAPSKFMPEPPRAQEDPFCIIKPTLSFEPFMQAVDEGTPEDRHEELAPMTDQQCLIAVSRVLGFDLDNKEWAEFRIADIQEYHWNPNILDKLVLDANTKKMIMAFAARADPEKNKFHDLVQDKGRGVIMLLCGPPGVGKTLTAESVSENGQLPLYIVSAGDIGSNPSTADNKLKEVLDCCRLWKAILLIDEADVFLEKRGMDNIQRNELVYTFLRRLEYYQGIMFLTTNRANAIDPAFESRIDLIIPYFDLDTTARRAVWSNFLTREAQASYDVTPDNSSGSSDTTIRTTVGEDGGKLIITEAELAKLSEQAINGREIKNVVKMAHILAAHEGQDLSYSHLDIVLGLRIRASNVFSSGGPQQQEPGTKGCCCHG